MKELGEKTAYFVIFIVLIIIDQSVKYEIRTSGGFYICNPGIAFGIRLNWAAALLCLMFFSFLLFEMRRTIWANQKNYGRPKLKNKPSSSLKNYILNIAHFRILDGQILKLGLIFIASGGISNLMDRMLHGCVIDFINLPFWPVFNLADIYITIGVMFILMTFSKKLNQ